MTRRGAFSPIIAFLIRGVPPIINPIITAMVEGAKIFLKSIAPNIDDTNRFALSDNVTLVLLEGTLELDIKGSVH